MKEMYSKDPGWIEEVLQASNTGIWTIVVDQNTGRNYMYADDSMLSLLGLPQQLDAEECYRHWSGRIDEKYRNYVNKCVEQMMYTGKFIEVQYQWNHPQWGRVFVRCGGLAEKQEEGRIRLRGYHQNVNELELLKQEKRLRNAELEEIRQQEKNYNDLFNSVLCGILNYVIQDNTVVFTKINKEALRMFEYTWEEFHAKKQWDISELVKSEDIGTVKKGLETLRLPGDKINRELRFLTKEGRAFWVIENTELILDKNGKKEMQSVFIDIDDNKKKTVMLQEITENIPGGVCLLELDTYTLMYGNEGFYDLFGSTEQEMREVNRSKLDAFIRKVDKKRINTIVRSARANKQKSVEFELPVQRPDNKKIWLLVRGTIINSCGTLQLNCVLIDITDRKNMERELFLNERRLSIALEQTANIVFDFDIKNGRAILKNGNFGPMVPAGIVDNAAENLVSLGILHQDNQKDFEDMWKQVANGSEMASKEIRVKYKMGGPFVWTKAVLRTIYAENGVPLRAVGILEDISLQKTAELAFIKEEKYRQAMLAETFASAEININHNTIEKASGVWEMKDKDMTYDQILERLMETEIYYEDKEQYYEVVSREGLVAAYDSGRPEVNIEYRRVDSHGRVIWMRLTAHLLREPVSGDLKALAYLKDIDKEKRAELAIKYQSERDSLTGLYNKGTAEQMTKSFLEEESRKGVCHAFIIVDLDHFKTINDSYGHQYGDEVLRRTAAILKETFRVDDIEGRLGGDEMAVLMKNVPSTDCVKEKLELVRQRFLKISEDKADITASIGVSFFREHGEDYKELYRTADIALYRAKEEGRNRYIIYSRDMEK